MRICIPTKSNEGKRAKVHDHFGSAEYFTIIDLDNDSVEIIKNTNNHHSHGMCHPISVIGNKSIDIIIAQGMGARAVQKLNEGGIKAYRSNAETVQDVINNHNAGKVEEITIENACVQHNCH